MNNNGWIENRTFDELAIGDSEQLTRSFERDDVATWAAVTGNVDLFRLYDALPADDASPERGVYGMWGASLFSAIIGTRLPGPGGIVESARIRFLRPMLVETRVTASVEVIAKDADRGTVDLGCRCTDEDGKVLIEADVVVVVPTEKLRQPLRALPKVTLRRENQFEGLLERCENEKPLLIAVAHPCSDDALRGAVLAAERGLITPILVGPEAKIRAVAERIEVDLADFRMVAADHSHHAAERAVALVRSGEADALMKGSLHTDELLSAVLNRENGLRTERRLSHCFLVTVPTYPRPMIVSDAAINISPDLGVKRDICQNAIDMARAIGISKPRVAILSAVETVSASIPSTIEAAALCKMADRGQIEGGIVDGPLAFDNAVDEAAARIKGISSPVAGRADILIVPDLEAGNMLAKQLTYMADAEAAGVVVGARVPIVLTSRADSSTARLASCAVAALMARAELDPGKSKSKE
ncbi:MAG: bifunctional enoyl-CoA hydratase/phosphate acetyltransferase [Rhodospirillales bacterium]|nr:MAG: bifunctional enoyl-CoA hydratase/phosphate acetyltransferase [Rhodospirillales bacterium]